MININISVLQTIKQQPNKGKDFLKSYQGLFSFNNFIYLFLEKEERNINVWLSLECPLLGTRPTT